MSWVTFIWSMTAGICLALGAVHFLIWIHQRGRWENLVFSISAAAAAGYAVFDMLALHSQTPSQYGRLLQWTLLFAMSQGVAIAWFVHLYLQAGRMWLLWLICGVRAVMIVLNFFPGPNFYFSEITGLRQTPLLGELISRPLGVLHPWAILIQISVLMIIIFVLDAAHAAAKKRRRERAWLTAGIVAGGFALAILLSSMYIQGILPSAFSGQLMLMLILLMGYEVSRDMLRASQLAGELRESEQRLILAADAANLGLWTRDLKQNRIWATANWRELLGFAKSEPISFDSYLEKIHPEDRESIRRTLAAAVAGSGEYETEYRVMLPEGRVRWIASRGRVDLNGDGKPSLQRGVSVDITARKKAEDELVQHRSELSHLSRVSTMSELSSSLAHELNQPLAIILTNAQAAQRLLAQEPPDIDETRDILADIVSEDQRAGEVIRRLRALLKPGGSQQLPLSANEVVADVLRIARSDLIARGVTVHTDLADSAPLISGDRIQLQQVLLNLILNASDAMAAIPAEERQLLLATQCDNGLVKILVSDTGCGLPPEHERIFQPFYTTKKDGLGLGLAICRSIVTAHKGRLWAGAHEAGNEFLTRTVHGATLHLELPALEQRI